MTTKNKPEIGWQAQSGSQALFLHAPVREVLYEGTRGPGKTDALLMDFAQHVGQGFGVYWRGILFRESFPQLKDIISKTKRWFPFLFPEAKYNGSDYKWVFPEGEELILSYMRKKNDYWNYHGHEYPWIAWEELVNWKDNECYEIMKSCNRSSFPGIGMPRKYRATANPYGLGHSWVKQYFIDPAPPGVVIKDRWDRMRIKGYLSENKILQKSDPEYVETLRGIKDPNLRKAWLHGSWDIASGGALTDIWDEKTHVIEPFEIPEEWYVDRSFDWGSSAPFSVGWWAESDGSEVKLSDGTWKTFPPGTLFRIYEYYGWNETPNKGLKMSSKDIAKNIIDFEDTVEILKDLDIEDGPADSSIFDEIDSESIASKMESWYDVEGNYVEGVRWEKANKKPGSRANGLQLIRDSLTASALHPMEAPGMFVFNTCRQFIRTVPTLPRDPKKKDDVDTKAEDHIYDEVRYRLLAKRNVTSIVDIYGM